jgi:RNA polymerase sigma-70 factor, ECF subfamily
MSEHDDAIAGRARRFREAALPCLDDAYRFACFLLQDRADADKAVQKCYRLAAQRFDGKRGAAIKPWLFGILRSVCRSDFARHAQHETAACQTRHADEMSITQLLGALPPQLREILVLRECSRLSYREIAEVVGASTSTVMSRLAQARAMLAVGWPLQNDATDQSAIRRREPDVFRRPSLNFR